MRTRIHHHHDCYYSYYLHHGRLSIRSLLHLLLLLLLLLNTANAAAHSSSSISTPALTLNYELPTDKKYAYVTLLYNDDFAFAVRTLGQSLRDTANSGRNNHPNIDHLVLVTSGVSPQMQQLLQQEGWTVKQVQAAVNPNAHYAKRLSGVYTKLEIFRQTEYHRLVYLDADTTLLENTDELFLCGPFCAVMRHSELINTGIIVVEPNVSLYEDMRAKVADLYSYTGGDQGFLNSYYRNYANCAYWEPLQNIGMEQNTNNNQNINCRRLPHRYNGDWPIAMLNGKLEMVRTKNYMDQEFAYYRKSRILHYTVGAFKPWDWYAPLLFPFTQYYTRVAQRLPKTAADYRQRIRECGWIVLGTALFYLWYSVTMVGGSSSAGKHKQYRQYAIQRIRQVLTPRSSGSCSSISRTLIIMNHPLSRPALFLHLVVGYASFVTSMGIGFIMVSNNTRNANMGFAIFLIWTFAMFYSIYSIYLFRWYLQGVTLDTNKNTTTSASTNSSSSTTTTTDDETTLSLLLLRKPNTNLAASTSTKRNNNKQPKSNALQESKLYAFAMMVLTVLFVYVRIHTPTEGLGDVLPALIGFGLCLLTGLTYAFYRLPLLWYQEGIAMMPINNTVNM